MHCLMDNDGLAVRPELEDSMPELEDSRYELEGSWSYVLLNLLISFSIRFPDPSFGSDPCSETSLCAYAILVLHNRDKQL